MVQGLSGGAGLQAWEYGQGQSLVTRALVLLAAAYPDLAPVTLANLTIGQRDNYLLRLRQAMFGSALVCRVACPNCPEQLELNFDLKDVLEPAALPDEPLSVSRDGYTVAFRLPTSLDLAAIVPFHRELELEQAHATLLARCILEVRDADGEEKASQSLPPGVVEAITQEMSRADPQAEIRLALQCAACGHSWESLFDIVAFLWEELNGWAWRQLREVHQLATAYGWSEAEILALSPWRRQFYLEMIGNHE